ncbi:GNAT family N-acetyltransferase [uncultured Ramlibacter sp.]|uniref:GNAT family N-acetyltransferase n=1 Tax=uncultured Ramlibacter sp. TaxID=260755 RepID=UPI0026118B50|nr:GNAT family N-acetyltransferase [uncultured Ramlibacter sp.]
MSTDPQVSNNSSEHRYEITVAGALAGFAQYRLEGEAVVFFHTEIGAAFEGQGLASKLARFALDDARAQGLHVVPECEFFAGYIRKKAEYQDLVRAEDRARFKI